MLFQRYTTDDRDLAIEDQRDLILAKDDLGNILLDVVPVGENSEQPILIAKNKKTSHEVYIALDAVHACMQESNNKGSKVLNYYDLKDEAQAWRDEFGSADKARFPEFNVNSINISESVAFFMSDDLKNVNGKFFEIVLGGNQDWYISVSSKNNRDFRAVRLCTSGGACWRIPRLSTGIAETYRALLSSSTNPEVLSPNYETLYTEVFEWRKKYPNYTYQHGFITKNLQ